MRDPHTAPALRFLLAVLIAAGSGCRPATPDAGRATVDVPAAAADTSLDLGHVPRGTAVPDFGFMVTPVEYAATYADQPVFRLKIDYPAERPAKGPAFVEAIDFRARPMDYLLAARDYAFDGNLPEWNPWENPRARWYHIPWLHPTAIGAGAYPPNGGTEGFRGLIKEAPITPLQLGPGQKGKDGNYSVYAITLVNDVAGYTLGRMWADPDNPDPRVTDRRYGGGFLPGTVFAKLLFTDAPQGDDHLPFLENPLQWQAYITGNFWTSSTRTVTAVNLLQMDIAIRDTRADDTTGWVFGSFAYNGQVNNPNKFLNLVPIGLMWGNDPGDTTNTTTPFPPTTTVVNAALKESVVFPSAELPPQHLGWNGRLNGPADLNTTSCLSCHITAQYPAVTSLVPTGAVPDGGAAPPSQGGSPGWMRWFQNIPAATSFDERVYSTDFSFQVAISLQNFFDVNATRLQGAWASDYVLPARAPIARGRVGQD